MGGAWLGLFMGPPFSTGFRMKVGGLVLAAAARFRTSEDEGRGELRLLTCYRPYFLNSSLERVNGRLRPMPHGLHNGGEVPGPHEDPCAIVMPGTI